MKGVVFTEFLELVEQSWGLDMADRLLVKGCPFHGGYTAVGTYDHRDLLTMVQELAFATETPVNELVKAFGKYLFGRFLIGYPAAFDGVDNTFALLERVEKTIHVEVHKLSPDAELPQFDFPPAPAGELIIHYKSKRPFADLAEGLIQGAIEHFGEQLSIERHNPDDSGCQAQFHLKPLRINETSLPCTVAEQSATAGQGTNPPPATLPSAATGCPFTSATHT